MSGTYRGLKTAWERWFIKEAYPLYVTVGLGCAACVFQLGRLAFANPDAHIFKKYRMAGMPDDDRDMKRGENFYNHGVRRFVHGKEIGIFPNSKFTKPQEHKEDED